MTASFPRRPAGLFVRDDDEGLFSRDINGQLVRLDAPTEADYGKKVTLQIDGQDDHGAARRAVEGREGQHGPGHRRPHDAALHDDLRRRGEAVRQQAGDEAKIPIPMLCHQPHMTPVAVCRLCVVQIYGQKRGKRAAERKLLPACQHQVKDGMEVFTMNAPGPTASACGKR